jgi:hypothetical protein
MGPRTHALHVWPSIAGTRHLSVRPRNIGGQNRCRGNERRCAQSRSMTKSQSNALPTVDGVLRLVSSSDVTPKRSTLFPPAVSQVSKRSTLPGKYFFRDRLSRSNEWSRGPRCRSRARDQFRPPRSHSEAGQQETTRQVRNHFVSHLIIVYVASKSAKL